MYPTYRWVWGENAKGELGNFADQNSDRPILSSAVPAGTVLTRLAAGSNAPVLGSHSLAVDENRNVWAWGFNIHGQVGHGTVSNAVFNPVKVCAASQTAPCTQFLSDITAVAAGGLHSLALDMHSNVWAWGHNGSGQLGASVGDTATPVRNNALFAQLHQLPGPPSIKAIAAGAHHSLALDSRGVVWAWGANASGQLGDGSTTARSLPVLVNGLTGVVGMSAGDLHSLAVTTGGGVYAWGANTNGRLGDGTTTQRNLPTAVSNMLSAAAVAAGAGHSLALKSDGTVWSWGLNDTGAIGDGTKTNRFAPTQASGLSGAVGIAEGSTHAMALTSSGTLYAWGDNSYGELGHPASIDPTTPSPVLGI